MFSVNHSHKLSRFSFVAFQEDFSYQVTATSLKKTWLGLMLMRVQPGREIVFSDNSAKQENAYQSDLDIGEVSVERSVIIKIGTIRSRALYTSHSPHLN